MQTIGRESMIMCQLSSMINGKRNLNILVTRDAGVKGYDYRNKTIEPCLKLILYKNQQLATNNRQRST
uniref:Uncharacterized protein n=1 Tax=Rhizophora mucronata TaxID=61149 RepID=A0A2P2KTB3_RHIMU